MNDTNSKSVSGAMKFLKISAIGTMLLSVGSTYAFNPDTAFAESQQSDTQTTVQVSDSDYAALTESLSKFSYNDVRADHYAYNSIEWAAKHNLFNDGGKGDFNPSQKVTESELVSVIANYYGIEDSYDAFAKYQLSLNGYSDTNLRSHNVKMGEFAQIISELTNNQRGNLDESLSYLNKNKVIDVGTVSNGESISDLAGSELLLDNAQLAVLMQKVDINHLTISSESKAIYNSNKDSSIDELTATINKDSVVPVAQVTVSKSSKSNITTVSKSNSDDDPTFVITPGESSDTNLTPEKQEKLKESEAKRNHDLLVEKYMDKIEKDRAPVKGAKIKKYTHDDSKDYVKSNKVYEYYKVYWTKTSKVIYVGVPVRTASSYDKAIFSTSGNHVDSKAKLTAAQKKIISTLTKSKAYSKKYRYIALYRYNTSAKTTDIYVVPKTGKSANYEINNHASAFIVDSKGDIVIPRVKSKDYKSTIKTGYDLNVLSHVATAKAWETAFNGGYHKDFHGYRIVDNAAFKINK